MPAPSVSHLRGDFMFDLAISLFVSVLNFSLFQPLIFALISVFVVSLFFKILLR